MAVKLLVEWLAKLPERPRTIFKTCAYGFVAGLVAVAFQLAMNGCYRAGIVRLSHCTHTTFLWSSFAVIIGTSLISGWLINSFLRRRSGQRHPAIKGGILEKLWVRAVPCAVGKVYCGHITNRRRQQLGPRRSKCATGGHGKFAAGGDAG